MAGQDSTMEKNAGKSASKGPEASPSGKKKTGGAEGAKTTGKVQHDAKGAKGGHGKSPKGKGDGVNKDGSKTVAGPSKGAQGSSAGVTKSKNSPKKVGTTGKEGANDTQHPASEDEDLPPLGRTQVKKYSLPKFAKKTDKTYNKTLKQRIGIDFAAYQPTKKKPQPKKKSKATPKAMEATPSASKKHGIDAGADGDDEMSPIKKIKTMPENDVAKGKEIIIDEEPKDLFYNIHDESDADRFGGKDTPPESGDDEASASPAKHKSPKKDSEITDETMAPQGNIELTNKEFRNMVDRYNTIVRRVKYQSLHAAIVECIPDKAMREKIGDKALDNFLEGMDTEIKDDTKNVAMAAYYARVLHPNFILKPDDGKKQTPDEPDDRLFTNASPRVNSSSRHPFDGDAEEQEEEVRFEGEQDLLFTGTEQSPRDRSHGKEESVTGDHKFEYPIYVAHNTQGISRSYDLRDHAVPHPETFTSREQANAKLLELTNYENFDGVTRKEVFEYTPLKLLKAKLTLSSGEQRVLWVDRHVVDLRNLTKREQSSRKWSAKRPALPHFIVECEFMTRSTSEEPQQVPKQIEPTSDSDDDDEEGGTNNNNIQISDEQIGDYTGDLELERLPLATFTDRQLANDHAGLLFLRHSAVREEIRTPLDDFWWTNNAIPAHKEATQKAGEKDGRYVAEIYTMDMNTRLGFDWMRVAVYAVDDVTGPLNI
ncbi:hypothetical protein ABKA04_000157 [Annulohypoxylon sp. FPYF3050]